MMVAISMFFFLYVLQTCRQTTWRKFMTLCSSSSAAASRSCRGSCTMSSTSRVNWARSNCAVRPTLPVWTSWCGLWLKSRVRSQFIQTGNNLSFEVVPATFLSLFFHQELRTFAPNYQRSCSPRRPVKSSSLTCPSSFAAYRWQFIHLPHSLGTALLKEPQKGEWERNFMFMCATKMWGWTENWEHRVFTVNLFSLLFRPEFIWLVLQPPCIF